MGFTKSTTDVKVHQSMADYPRVEDGFSAEELKKKFDAPAEQLQKDLNKLVDELERKEEGFEASRYISSGKLFENDTTGNVQEKLLLLKKMIDETALGSIPDDSITKNKLDINFANTIPSNERMGVLYLASKYNEPINNGKTFSEYLSPSLRSESHNGYNLSAQYHNSDISDIYTMLGGNGNEYIRAKGNVTAVRVFLEMPVFVKVEEIQLTIDGTPRTYGTVYGSTDGINYETLNKYSINTADKTNIKINGNNKYYKFIKIELWGGSISDDYAVLYNNIKIVGLSLQDIENVNVLEYITNGDGKLSTYENGQIVKIITPSTFVDATNINATLNINSLGAKQIPNDLLPSKRYSLVYDGEKFVHESEV